jgi:formylglycine-generating enzyme required for sulfatase activity
MSGNAFTWCEDNDGPYDPKDLIDPRGPEPKADGAKRLRGGSWDDDDPEFLRAAFRIIYGFPDYRHGNVGFRVGAPAPQDSR